MKRLKDQWFQLKEDIMVETTTRVVLMAQKIQRKNNVNLKAQQKS